MAFSYYFSEPFSPFTEFDRLFDDAFANRTSNNNTNSQVQPSSSTSMLLRPRMDVHEDAAQNAVTATFELPGLRKEDVRIDVRDGVLTVSGESESEAVAERDERGYAVRERRCGRFARSIALPQGLNTEEIKAAMEDGVLSVTFPKTSPEQAVKIAIA